MPGSRWLRIIFFQPCRFDASLLPSAQAVSLRSALAAHRTGTQGVQPRSGSTFGPLFQRLHHEIVEVEGGLLRSRAQDDNHAALLEGGILIGESLEGLRWSVPGADLQVVARASVEVENDPDRDPLAGLELKDVSLAGCGYPASLEENGRAHGMVPGAALGAELDGNGGRLIEQQIAGEKSPAAFEKIGFDVKVRLAGPLRSRPVGELQ